LTPDDIREPVHTLSSAAPQSSTAALAGAVPKESEREAGRTISHESIPGAFPLTPMAETPSSEPMAFHINPIPATEGAGNPIKLAAGEPVPDPSTFTDNTIQSTVNKEPEAESFGVAPIPATEGAGNPIKLAPGEPVPDPSTFTDNTIQSTVNTEPEAESFGVAPIPATAGFGNPIHLAPGEKVPDPSTLTSNTISSTARTDPESYDKSDGLPPQLGPVDLTPTAEREAKGGMFSLPPLVGSLIPESSLPKDWDVKTEQDPGFTIQSAAPTSTTAALAGNVPLEPRGVHDVPETVTASQEEAGFNPEAAANPEAVEEKKEVEEELKAKVPEVPAAADNSTITQIGAAIAGGASVAAGAFAAATYAAKDKAAKTIGLNGNATATSPTTSIGVPEVVTESQKEAHVSPEASANVFAVQEKKEVEQELKAKVPEEPAAGSWSAKEIGATAAAGATVAAGAVAGAAFAAKDKVAETVGSTGQSTVDSTAPISPAGDVPVRVVESLQEAHVSPEAAANAEAVVEKDDVEQELLSKTKKTYEHGESAPKIVGQTGQETAASGVPEVVAESQKEAHASPEAAANPEAVEEKGDVEQELLNKVKKTDEAGESAPKITGLTGQETVASDVPEVVAESQKEAHASPEAAANPEAVEEKADVEQELLNKVKKTNEAGEPAPTITAATSAVAPGLSDDALVDSKPLKSSSEPDALAVVSAAGASPLQTESSKAPVRPESPQLVDSRDVSPMSKQPTKSTEQTQPIVTSGVESTTVPAKSTPETPKKATIAESSNGTPQSIASDTTDRKKKNRRSFFGRIKDKLRN
jgi:hypothetical protein